MSKKSQNLEFVKHVPDFIAKMGLSQQQLTQHNEKNKEYSIEDKKRTEAPSKEEDKEEYDFENAQIEDLANML